MEYSVAKGGEQLGSFSREQIAKMLADGQLAYSDLIWTQGMPDWKSLGEHPDFATSPPPIPVSASNMRAEDDWHADYEAFIGPEKSGYYVPIFERFDAGGSSAAWNLPAALFTSWWMIYRGMYLWGLLVYPILNWIFMALLSSLLGVALGKSGFGSGYLIGIPSSMLLAGLYANKLFHHHVRKKIEASKHLRLTPQQRHDWLVRKGATGYIWILFVFLGPAIIGILAAIAIPAYMDFTVRAQVAEGMNIAARSKVAVANYYAQHNAFPADNASAELPDATSITGQYVTGVDIDNDKIEITYGRAANGQIAGKKLVYVGTASPATGTIIWRCNTDDSDIANKYLPATCRR
jgi:type IV pilus assembly protein PilA